MRSWTTAVLVVTAMVLGPVASPAAAESIDVGMPFSGKWAYNVPAPPPYDDVGDSHPAAHWTPGGGDWGTDLYAPAGTTVRLRLANATGAVSYSWMASSTSCGTSTRVRIAVDGVDVGWIYIAHLAGAVTSGPISNGMKLGTVANLSCNPGHHVHIEVRTPHEYACYQNLGQPGAATIADGAKIGTLGPMVSGPKQACPSGSNPVGAYDTLSSPQPGTVRVRGWSFDADDRTRSLSMHVYVGGQAGDPGATGYAFTANASRPDVGNAYPGVGSNHGLDATFETSKRGSQPVCLYAINVGGGANVLLGCKTVTIADPNPYGNFESVSSPVGGTIHVAGWAVDPSDPTRPIAMHVYVGGAAGQRNAIGYAFTADAYRPDVNRVHPGVGDRHGLDRAFETVQRGRQQVCVYAIDTGPGDNVALGCKAVTIGDPPPPPSAATQPAPPQPSAPTSGDPPPAPLTPPALPQHSASTVSARPSVRFPQRVDLRRRLRMTCTGLRDGARLKVRFSHKHRKTITRLVHVRDGAAKVKPPRRRGRYHVRIASGGKRVAAGIVRVR